jgi:hypothetical protein
MLRLRLHQNDAAPSGFCFGSVLYCNSLSNNMAQLCHQVDSIPQQVETGLKIKAYFNYNYRLRGDQ